MTTAPKGAVEQMPGAGPQRPSLASPVPARARCQVWAGSARVALFGLQDLDAALQGVQLAVRALHVAAQADCLLLGLLQGRADLGRLRLLLFHFLLQVRRRSSL